MTFNEPRVVASLGYDNGLNAPGRCSKAYENCNDGNSATLLYIVAHNLILAHASAIKIYRDKYQSQQKGRIGILLDVVWYEPLTTGKKDGLAAQRARDYHLGWIPLDLGKHMESTWNIFISQLRSCNPDVSRLSKLRSPAKPTHKVANSICSSTSTKGTSLQASSIKSIPRLRIPAWNISRSSIPKSRHCAMPCTVIHLCHRAT